MKVVIAIDSYKGSLSSSQGQKAIAAGIQAVFPDADIVGLPLADGGENTVEALVRARNGQFIAKEVTGPLHGKVEAVYGILEDGKTAVIEVAAACGLPLVPPVMRNPWETTTYGVGELILDAIERGCRNFIIGLGGSSTNDAGIGMLRALGYRFKTQLGEEVIFGGKVLERVTAIETDGAHPALKESTFRAACDVQSPLYGPTGAAYIFGPQKGASPEMVQKLDQGLRSFAHIIQSEMGTDVNLIPGAGAAGGLGAAFAGFMHAQLISGIELILEMIGMEEKLDGADLVITGEGRLDGQTSMGKAPLGVARAASQRGIPVIALAGSVSREASSLNPLGVTSYFSIVPGPLSLEEAMDCDNAYENLRITTEQLFRLLRATAP